MEVGYWHRLPDGRIQCDLCPRHCRLSDGQHGFCFGRARRGDKMILVSYGRSSGLAVDPIEKKPLFHFLPGSQVLSFGTVGCNLGCSYCQNWHISTCRSMSRLGALAQPDEIAEAARDLGCESVAFTYNDPVAFMEYARDTAIACHEAGIRTVAVTAGYIEPEPRADLFEHIDAANVDLKAFDDGFYRIHCAGRLEPVLDTLRWIADGAATWLEITTLIIPGLNDSDDEIRSLGDWVAAELGTDVPLHLSAFHPAGRMRDRPPTSPAVLRRARRIAQDCGLRYVYVGNVHDPEGESTCCPGCGKIVIARSGFEVIYQRLNEAGRCAVCDTQIAGVFE